MLSLFIFPDKEGGIKQLHNASENYHHFLMIVKKVFSAELGILLKLITLENIRSYLCIVFRNFFEKCNILNYINRFLHIY